MKPSRERTAQKLRTREAILAGARDLLNEGLPITVAAAAEKKGISRATAYRYFRDPAALTAEAGLSIEVDDYADVIAGANTLRDKLMAINLYFFDLSARNEAGFRLFIARSMEASLAQSDRAATRRGARRIRMYHTALDEAGAARGKARDIMCHSLATVTGMEAFIALTDVCGLDVEAARNHVKDMTQAIMDRHLQKLQG